MQHNNPPLDPKTAAKRAARLASAPASVRKLLIAAWAGKGSPRQAIKAQCLECQGFDRPSVASCTCVACPLWAFRPFQGKGKQ
jgi:hypothetical protein